MQMRALMVAAVAVLAAGLVASCNSKSLRTGYCNTNTDCQAGMTCDTKDGGTFKCLPTDSGAGGAAGKSDGGAGKGGSGGAGGGGGHPFRCDASTQCSERNDGAAPVCELDGASCVGCLVDGDCTEDPTKPICGSGHTCGPCVMGTTNQCAGHTGKTVCARSGSCVECVTSSDCTADKTKPICGTTNQCQSCVADSDCVSKGATDPGVCMTQTDGHCATPSETIYVQNTMTGTGACSDTAAGAGISAQPFCSMQPVPATLTTARDLVVVRGTVSGGTSTFMGQGAPVTSIVGQQTAFIASGASPAFSMQSGSVYIRSITFSPSASIGISATGGMLHLDTVTIESCKGGGILLDGTSFEIDNTTVENNGPSADLSWGGIRVQNPPSSGPLNLNLVSVTGNNAAGISCSGSITGVGVLATGNMAGNIVTSCNVTACSPAGLGCGAQP
jgi:hypothetical protein